MGSKLSKKNGSCVADESATEQVAVRIVSNESDAQDRLDMNANSLFASLNANSKHEFVKEVGSYNNMNPACLFHKYDNDEAGEDAPCKCEINLCSCGLIYYNDCQQDFLALDCTCNADIQWGDGRVRCNRH